MRPSSFKICAVLGQSQHGKSSFINFLSGCNSQPVGSNDGRSCTIGIIPVLFNDAFELFEGENTELRFFDVPGFGDSEMRITNREILDKMKITLAGLESRQFDGLFVFQSLMESSINLKETLVRIECMFGEKVYRSVVVIMTKSDLVAPRALSKRVATVEHICQEKRLPCVQWINNSPDFGPVPPSQQTTQISALRSVVPHLRPYEMMDMAEYEQLVRKRAQLIMAKDTSNTVTHTVEVQTKHAEVFTEKQTVMVSTVKQAYTEEEVKAKALEARARPENKKAEVVLNTTLQDDFEYEVLTETRTVSDSDSHLLGLFRSNCNYTITEQKIVKKPVKRQIQKTSVEYVSQPVEVFERSLRDQKKQVEEAKEIEVQRMREKKAMEQVTVTTTKHDVEHYLQQAAKEIARETR